MKQHKLFWAISGFIVFVFIATQLERKPKVRGGPHSPQGRSMVQLRTLAQGCFVYASESNDQFPDATQWRTLLIEQEIVNADQLQSPSDQAGEVSYHMAPNATMWDERSILLYEDPDHWDDFVIVAFGDASAEQMPHDEFERRLAEQLKGDGP